MELLRKDFEVVYKNFVLNDLSLNELILQIISIAEIDDAENFIFKQSFYNLSVRCGQMDKYFTGKDLSSIRKRTTSVRKNCRNIGRVEKEKSNPTKME